MLFILTLYFKCNVQFTVCGGVGYLCILDVEHKLWTTIPHVGIQSVKCTAIHTIRTITQGRATLLQSKLLLLVAFVYKDILHLGTDKFIRGEVRPCMGCIITQHIVVYAVIVGNSRIPDSIMIICSHCIV